MPRKAGYTHAEGLTPEKVDQLVKFTADIASPPMKDYHDIAELERRFAHYMSMCAKYGKAPGNMACYLALGVSRQGIHNWADGRGTPEQVDFARKVLWVMAAIRETLGAEGVLTPALVVYWQGNFDKLQDVRNIKVVATDTDQAEIDAATLADKYLDAANLTAPAIAPPEPTDTGEADG